MISDSDDPGCDVIGYDKPSTGTYMNGVSSPGYRFFVCDEHQARLLDGEQPVIVAERFHLAQMDVGPALYLR